MTTRDVSGQQGRPITTLPLVVIDWIKARPIRIPVQKIWNWDEDEQKNEKLRKHVSKV